MGEAHPTPWRFRYDMGAFTLVDADEVAVGLEVAADSLDGRELLDFIALAINLNAFHDRLVAALGAWRDLHADMVKHHGHEGPLPDHLLVPFARKQAHALGLTNTVLDIIAATPAASTQQ